MEISTERPAAAARAGLARSSGSRRRETLQCCYHLDYQDGVYPAGDLVQGTDGNFYGTAQRGGSPYDRGILFTVTPTGSLTVLHRFDPNDPTDGVNPYAGLVQAPAMAVFYGVTASGGVNNSGAIFKVTSSGDVTNLYSFSGTDGAEPYGALMQGSDGALYGTSRSGGASGFGTTLQDHDHRNLHEFTLLRCERRLASLRRIDSGERWRLLRTHQRRHGHARHSLPNDGDRSYIHRLRFRVERAVLPQWETGTDERRELLRNELPRGPVRPRHRVQTDGVGHVDRAALVRRQRWRQSHHRFGTGL